MSECLFIHGWFMSLVLKKEEHKLPLIQIELPFFSLNKVNLKLI